MIDHSFLKFLKSRLYGTMRYILWFLTAKSTGSILIPGSGFSNCSHLHFVITFFEFCIKCSGREDFNDDDVQKERSQFKIGDTPSPFDFDKPHTGQMLADFKPVTTTKVAELLNSMSNKSSPLDYIATSLLKSCAGTFSILISHLANLSFDQATFPSKFKHALIAPLLKKPGLSQSDETLVMIIHLCQLEWQTWSQHLGYVSIAGPHFCYNIFNDMTHRRLSIWLPNK